MTVKEYLNIFNPKNPNHQEVALELIEGRLVNIEPKGANYKDTIDRMSKPIKSLSDGTGYVVLQHKPLALDDYTCTRPDLIIVNKATSSEPLQKNALLVAEVANITSSGLDAHTKANVYAKYNVQEYWLRNVSAHCLELFQKPKEGRYTRHCILRAGESFYSIYDEKLPINVIP
jgi:Uma2 family endonuclease